LNVGPDKGNFPRRNRLIAALSLGTLVIEAGLKSGALITAAACAEQGKDVFAVPGPIFSDMSIGTHGLIKSGARLVESALEVIDELRPLKEWVLQVAAPLHAGGNAREDLTGPARSILELIETELEGISIDELGRRSEVSRGELVSGLLELELKGCVRSLPGKMYVSVK